MDDPSVAGIHRLEGYDFTLIHGLLSEATRHAGQSGLPAESVTLGVNYDMPAVQSGSIDGPMGQELKRSQHLTALAYDAPRIPPEYFYNNFRCLAFLFLLARVK